MLFVEEDPSSHERLKHFSSAISDIEIETRNATLEASVDPIMRFIKASSDAFPFIFIDPTGWTGFALDAIRPLLRLVPGEVLINFMTGHIRRFIDSPDEPTRESFERLFGSSDFRAALQGRSGHDREDTAVRRYMEAVKSAGDFQFSSVAMVLHPEIDRSHFHLIYLTRKSAGVTVFKQAERKSMQEMEKARAEAQQRRRVNKSGIRELFAAEDVHDRSHFDELREHYLARGKQELLSGLRAQGRLSYDEAWARTLENPLVWEADLKEWVREWKRADLLKIDGMEPKQREPRLNKSNTLVWRSGSEETAV